MIASDPPKAKTLNRSEERGSPKGAFACDDCAFIGPEIETPSQRSLQSMGTRIAQKFLPQQTICLLIG
jgi:hypothetical protein